MPSHMFKFANLLESERNEGRLIVAVLQHYCGHEGGAVYTGVLCRVHRLRQGTPSCGMAQRRQAVPQQAHVRRRPGQTFRHGDPLPPVKAGAQSQHPLQRERGKETSIGREGTLLWVPDDIEKVERWRGGERPCIPAYRLDLDYISTFVCGACMYKRFEIDGYWQKTCCSCACNG